MITVHDKQFELYMTEAEIQQDVNRVAAEISRDLKEGHWTLTRRPTL